MFIVCLKICQSFAPCCGIFKRFLLEISKLRLSTGVFACVISLHKIYNYGRTSIMVYCKERSYPCAMKDLTVTISTLHDFSGEYNSC